MYRHARFVHSGERFLESLIENEDYEGVQTLCPELFGHDAQKWEHWIYVFAKRRLLKV